eukprot:UN14027
MCCRSLSVCEHPRNTVPKAWEEASHLTKHHWILARLLKLFYLFNKKYSRDWHIISNCSQLRK